MSKTLLLTSRPKFQEFLSLSLLLPLFSLSPTFREKLPLNYYQRRIDMI